MSFRRSASPFIAVAAIFAAALAIHAQAPQAEPAKPAAPQTGAPQPAAGAQPQPAPRPRPVHDKPAEQIYQNIKVLNGMPSDELIETMQAFRAALGGNCDICHVHTERGLVPEAEDKKEKQTARQMIMMVRAINQQNFNGRNEVTCATCHNGHVDPVGIPPVLDLETAKARRAEEIVRGDVEAGRKPAEQLPSADTLFDKYTQAIGGQAAIAKLTTKVVKATVTPAVGSPFTVE